jgi:hypothetical protein
MRSCRLVSILIALVALGGLMLMASAVTRPSTTSAQRSGPPRPPDALARDRGFDPQTPEGVGAIQPSKDASKIGVATPAFTVEDVHSYIKSTKGQGLLVGAVPDRPIAIRSVEFLTDSQLRARHHGESTGKKDALLCYVELEGSFTPTGLPPGSGSEAGSGPAQCERAIVVFDAHTGNLLMSGIDCNRG